MSSVVKLKDYRIAKKYQEDYVYIKRIFDLSIEGLTRFKGYKPVASALAELQNQKSILEAHKKTADKLTEKEEK